MPTDPLTHDFDQLDAVAIEAIELHCADDGRVWFNVNGKCMFRAQTVRRIEINDQRKSKRRKTT
jgi:hypothetical protein